MSGDRDSSIWPFICILICLFVLSAVSPRAWERVVSNPAIPATNDTSAYAQKSGPPQAPEWDGTSPVVPQLSAIPPMVEPSDQDEVAAELPLDVLASPEGRVAGQEPSEVVDEAPVEQVRTEVEPALDAKAADEPPLFSLSDASVMSQWTGADALAEEVVQRVIRESKPKLPAEELAAAVWCEPVGLLEYLKAVSAEARTAAWAQAVQAQLEQLRMAMGLHSDDALAIVHRLGELRCEAETLATGLGQDPLASRLRRVQHALDRRIAIWTRVISMGGADTVAGRASEPDREELVGCLEEVDSLIGNLPGAEGWREYLELGTLRALGSAGSKIPSQLVAAEVLRRLTRVPMTAQQQRIASSGPMVRLADQMRNWAGEPVEVRHLLETVERYEQVHLASDARSLAANCIQLVSSPVVQDRVLGELLEAYYRNANFRLTFTADLVNRLVPKREPALEEVNDRVLGKPVYGQSMTTTETAFRFIPDASRLRAELVIRGLVSSETSSYSGPATFFNSSWSEFSARKGLELGLQGITLWPAEVEVQNDTRLRSVYTDFDVIPLLGTVAQEIARSQAEGKQPEVRRELEWKVSNRVKQQIDGEADARLSKASERLKDGLFGPLREMGLGPTLVSAETTESRMTMRLCLASPEQLGAHTPRPRMLGNSLASMQIHESALANVVEQLGLNGQTLTIAELRQRLASRLQRPEMLKNKDEHDDVSLRFAPQNAVTVRCQDGQMVITVAVACLREPQSGEQWENFQVRTCYQPHINGRRAEFAREGVIYLIGDGLNMRSQIALRGIFSKAFSKKRPLVLTPEAILGDPRLAGLGVSQIRMEDGWVSIALGPQSSSNDPMVARLPGINEEQ